MNAGRRLWHWPAALLLGLAGVAMAQSPSQCEKVREPGDAQMQGWTVTVDNDLFRPGTNTDRWYTNGVHVAGSYKLAHTPKVLHGWQDFWTRMFESGNCATVSMAAGQNMYTPRRINVAAAQPFDRPWGGFLYGGLGAYRFEPRRGEEAGFHDAVDLKVGAIGPASLAEEAQTQWHKLIGSPQPLGWANQLRPQLGVQAGFRRTIRHIDEGLWRLHSFYGGTLGNTRTQAVAGVTLHIAGGGHVFSDSDEGDFAPLDFNNRSGGHIGGFIQLQGKHVAYNRFITGPTFGQRADLELRREVLTASAGIMLTITPEWRMAYSIKRRSPEFTSAVVGRGEGYQTWGGITLIRDLDP